LIGTRLVSSEGFHIISSPRLHRVSRSGPPSFGTKGLHSPLALSTRRNLAGLFLFSIPFARIIRNRLRGPLGAGSGVYTPVVRFIVVQHYDDIAVRVHLPRTIQSYLFSHGLSLIRLSRVSSESLLCGVRCSEMRLSELFFPPIHSDARSSG